MLGHKEQHLGRGVVVGDTYRVGEEGLLGVGQLELLGALHLKLGKVLGHIGEAKAALPIPMNCAGKVSLNSGPENSAFDHEPVAQVDEGIPGLEGDVLDGPVPGLVLELNLRHLHNEIIKSHNDNTSPP